MSIVVDRWPDHKGSLHLTHNQHKSYYETVEEAIQSGTYLENYWVSQEQKEKAIATDCVWELQWYPNTPVSFSLRIACDLDALFEAEMPPSDEPTIEIDGRSYRKFIRYPAEVDDGTLRCISCGQIDEEDYHDHALCVAATTPSPADRLLGYQDRVAAALPALFHDDPTDVAERVARFFEEAVETCQALGLDFADAHKLVNYTYDRPVGEPAKEIGAALVTLASLCVVAGFDLLECGEADLEKLQRPETIARIRAKRATRHGRGPLPGFAAAASEGSADA